MAGIFFVALTALGADAGRDQLQALTDQNKLLQDQVRAQQKTIDALNTTMAEVLKASDRHERELRGLQDRAGESSSPAAASATREHEVRVAGETGIGFFQTGSHGQFPKAEFRADDPVITVEAPIRKDVYFFGELKLQGREAGDEYFQLGELYVDFENVSAAWSRPGLLSFRAGRIGVPFGEEYLVRGPVANPLISHSLSDIWGVDVGMEIYGKLAGLNYVVAVQNGGIDGLHDFNADKAVVARIGGDPLPWLHLSGSAMRTGELSTVGDGLSNVWFGNGFFRALGPAASTGKFWADLFEGDATARWKAGHVTAALGEAQFRDSNTTANNARRIRYGYVELVQGIGERLYGAARYSEISAPRGYPLAGWGNLGEYFFSPPLTERLQRMSVGIGYRFGDPLVLKFEYAWESGRMIGGARRDHENFFGSEIAVKF